MKTRAVIRISGDVQNVGYRITIHRAAFELDLVGHARNLEDGTVEVVVEGPKNDIERLAQKINIRRFPTKVEDIDITYSKPTSEFSRFTVIRDERFDGDLSGKLDLGLVYIQTMDEHLSGEIHAVGSAVKDVGMDVKGVGRDVKGVGRDVKGVGRNVKGVGRDVKDMNSAMGRSFDHLDKKYDRFGKTMKGMARDIKTTRKDTKSMAGNLKTMGCSMKTMAGSMKTMGGGMKNMAVSTKHMAADIREIRKASTSGRKKPAHRSSARA